MVAAIDCLPVVTRRQLLSRALGAGAIAAGSGLGAGLLGACRRPAGPTLLAVESSLPQAWLKLLDDPWQLRQLPRSEAVLAALGATPPQRLGLIALSDGWASQLPREQLQPFGAPQLLARLAPAAAPVSRLFQPPETPAWAYPWACSPWVLALRNHPELMELGRQSWDVLLDPRLRGTLVLPSSPRVSIELVGADPGKLRQLRRQALAYDEGQGLNLLLNGDARAAVLPLQRLIPLLRRDPRLQVVLPASGAPLGWQLLLRPAASRDALPLAWLARILEPPLLPKLLAGGWLPPLPRPQLERALRALPASLSALLLPGDGTLERCWSLPPLGERQRLSWQTLWDASAP